jgi:hypothetical protein
MSNRIPARPIKKSTIEENRERLLNAPIKEKEDFSLQEAIHDMATEINQILDRGYSYDEIATMLKDGGIDVKPTTLRQYLAQVTKVKVDSKAKSKPNSKAKTDVVKTASAQTDSVKADPVKTDIVDVAAKPSKPSKSAVKVTQNTSSGFVEMPDKL